MKVSVSVCVSDAESAQTAYHRSKAVQGDQSTEKKLPPCIASPLCDHTEKEDNNNDRRSAKRVSKRIVSERQEGVCENQQRVVIEVKRESMI